MAGINRLGKAPPKPGTLRPPDPNKYRTVDMFSEGAEGDADYMRMVQDIEDMQQQQGWLFGRGAFDKGDLLYLRDEAEKQRHAELELRDSEKTQFAALRAKFEKLEGQGDVIRIARKDRSGGRSQPELIANLVRVKSNARGSSEFSPENSPETKRLKCDDDAQPLHSPGPPVSESTAPEFEGKTGDDEGGGGGLGSLLGNYDSSSSGEEGEPEPEPEKGKEAWKDRGGKSDAVKLLDASELPRVRPEGKGKGPRDAQLEGSGGKDLGDGEESD